MAYFSIRSIAQRVLTLITPVEINEHDNVPHISLYQVFFLAKRVLRKKHFVNFRALWMWKLQIRDYGSINEKSILHLTARRI